MKKIIRLVAVVLALGIVLAPAPALAFTQRSGNTVVVSRPITDDLYVQGGNIEVTAPIDGDVVAIGQNITITGNVTGDVIAAGQNVSVRGAVGGTVRAAGSEVSVEGRVEKDILAAGNNVRIASGGTAGRDAVLAGSQVLVSGEVGRNVLASAQGLTIAAPVGGSVRAEVQELTLTSDGSIAGDLTYRSASQAQVDGTVAGQTQRLAPRNPQNAADGEEATGGAVVLALLGWVRTLIGLLIFGALVVLILRTFAERAAFDTAWHRPGISIGIGLAILVAAFPIAALVFIIGLLVGGWWIAFVWLAVVWILALVGIVIAALAVGGWILRSISHHAAHAMPAVLLGLVVLSVVGAIPFIGWLVYLLAMVWGMGAVIVTAYSRRDAWRHPSNQPAPQYTGGPQPMPQYPGNQGGSQSMPQHPGEMQPMPPPAERPPTAQQGPPMGPT